MKKVSGNLYCSRYSFRHSNLRLLRLTPRNDGRQQCVIANREVRAMKQSGFAQNLTARGIANMCFASPLADLTFWPFRIYILIN